MNSRRLLFAVTVQHLLVPNSNRSRLLLVHSLGEDELKKFLEHLWSETPGRKKEGSSGKEKNEKKTNEEYDTVSQQAEWTQGVTNAAEKKKRKKKTKALSLSLIYTQKRVVAALIR